MLLVIAQEKAAELTAIQRIGSGLAGVGKLGGTGLASKITQLRQRAAAGDKGAEDILSMLGVVSIALGSGAGAFTTHKLGLGRLLGATGGAVLGTAPALASGEKKTPITLPGFSVDSADSSAKMSAGSHDMDKVAAGGLLKLDAKGVSPAALQAVYSRDTQGAMSHPGIVALVSRRRERIRRIKDELNNPMSHLKPEKEEAAPMEEAAAMAGSPRMPMMPGGPQPPSNGLGMFGPETGGMGVPASSAVGMPASGMLPKLGGHPAELVKSSDEPVKKEARVNAYKYGFFAKIAELGMLPSEFVKVAIGAGTLLGAQTAGKAVEDVSGIGKWTLDKLLGAGKLAVSTPLVLGPLLGLIAGGAYRVLTAPKYETPKELRSIERTALYKRLGREAQRRAKRLQTRRLAASGEEERELDIPSVEAA